MRDGLSFFLKKVILLDKVHNGGHTTMGFRAL